MRFYHVVFLLITSSFFLKSQEVELVKKENVIVNHNHKACFPEDQRKLMIERIKTKSSKTSAVLSFRLPLEADTLYKHNGFHSISNFVDHEEQINSVRDYNCGDRSYDLQTGYNHKGTDYSLWPFGWEMMDNNSIRVVAAEAGTIIQKDDGNPDENCDFSNPLWNAIYIEHADGSESYYGHLKRGSLTSKQVGESVQKGEFLGIVGSSGQSTGPHLHFEVYDNAGNLIDPYQGTCNQNSTWWTNQTSYYDSKALRIDCHSLPPVIGQCKGETVRNRQHFFRPGDTIYFVSYYRDLTEDFENVYTMITPSSSEYFSWNYYSNLEYSSSSYLTWKITLPQNAELGLWGIQLAFNGDTIVDYFEMVDSPSSINDPKISVSNNSFELNTNAKRVNIYSVNGQLVKTVNHYSERLSIPMKPGIYIFEIYIDDKIFRIKQSMY